MIDDELVVGSGSALENDQVSCDMLVHGAEVSNSDTESEMDHEQVSFISTNDDVQSVQSIQCDSGDVIYNDLGDILKPSMSSDEICSRIKSLTSIQKYKLLTEHYTPGNSFSFPKVFNNGCYRSFQLKWLKKYPWLVYSKALNGGFCKHCALFVKDRTRYGVLVNKPFESWVKVHKVVDGHALNQYHVNAMADSMAFINSIKHPHMNVNVRMNAELLRNIEENRKILKCAETILYCGRQCIALRGHVEKLVN